MKKTIIALLATACALSSCWKGDILPTSDQDRHIITGLNAVAGDEEVALSWSVPDGWSPDDYIVTYTGSGDPTSIKTGGQTSCSLTGLENGTKYTFNVQAVYGTKISNQVSTTATPNTTRIPVSKLDVEAKSKGAVLSWTKPDENLLSYKLTYGIDGAGNDKTITIDKAATTYDLSGLTDDENYTFSLVAVYPKGDSTPVKAKAMPTSTVPFFISNLTPASGQIVQFRFNRSGYPTATDVKWTFPDGTTATDDVVEKGINATGVKKVGLSAKVDGSTKNWTAELSLREFVVELATLERGGAAYQGFKGCCPVFSPDGKVVYAVSFNKVSVLYAMSVETGKELWRYTPETASGSYNPVTVNPVTGDIYYGTTTAGQFFCVSPDGKLKWTYAGFGSMQSCAPGVSKDGNTVFAIDASGKVAAISAATGSELWTYAAGAKGGSLLVNGSELVVAPTTGDLVFLNTANGTPVASIASSTFSANRTDIAGFAVAADGNTAYLPCNKGMLYAIDLKNHSIIKSITLEDASWGGSNNLYEPVVAPNGNVFVGSKDSRAYCVKGDLSEVLWSISALASYAANAYNYSHPCCDADGNFYITNGQTQNVSLIINPTGTVLEQWQYGSSSAQKQMGGNNYLDGVLYAAFVGAGSEDGAFVGKYVGGKNASGWCRHGGDICGSCCLK